MLAASARRNFSRKRLAIKTVGAAPTRRPFACASISHCAPILLMPAHHPSVLHRDVAVQKGGVQTQRRVAIYVLTLTVPFDRGADHDELVASETVASGGVPTENCFDSSDDGG